MRSTNPPQILLVCVFLYFLVELDSLAAFAHKHILSDGFNILRFYVRADDMQTDPEDEAMLRVNTPGCESYILLRRS